MIEIRNLLKAFDNGSDSKTIAINHVNLTLEEGDFVTIIGGNGAGKSTMLKLISRITLPTEGCIRIRGKVASLLEVGTGFHPELSGRETGAA